MNADTIAKALEVAARWVPIAVRFFGIFKGDEKRALEKLDELEAEERRARDERMGR